MRIRAVVAAAALALAMAGATACGVGDSDNAVGGGFFRQYEYEEEVYLSLDGTATVYVNASLPALNALRGTTFATAPNAPLDRDAVRAYFTTPSTRLSGQMDDPGDLFAAGFDLGQHAVDRRLVADIRLDEAEPGLSFKLFETGAFQGDAVVIVEIVDADHLIAARQKRLGDMGADEAGGSCYQDRHPKTSVCSVRRAIWASR